MTTKNNLTTRERELILALLAAYAASLTRAEGAKIRAVMAKV